MAAPSPKKQFVDVYSREHETTLKVLRAYPPEKQDFQPNPKANTALKLAWTFVVENNISAAALKGPLNFGSGFPPAPATIGEAIAAYEQSATQLKAALGETPESRFGETIQFPTGRGQMGDFAVIDFLWFMLLDSIHHRGQMSTYLRCVDAKVPAIYGPTADEPWS